MNKGRTVILGGGESGVGAAALAKAQGMQAFVSDIGAIPPRYKAMLEARGIDWEEGGHTERMVLAADEIVKSPGISPDTPIMQKIAAKGIPVVSEIEYAGRHTRSQMLCVTGSNGKTTTATLTHHILQAGGVDVGLAGNVGNSLALQVAEQPHDYYVVELSSFQLDNMYDFRAHIAILLNITPDHLDRYAHRMEGYIDSKFRITRNQTSADTFIYWHDDPIIAREMEKRCVCAAREPFAATKQAGVKGYVADGEVVIESGKGVFRMPQELLSLAGRHNLYNSLAAGMAAKALGIGDTAVRGALSDFGGVAHRLEKVARVRGVDYINDSKATNVNACWYALQSVSGKVALILGGTDKGNAYEEIEEMVEQKARALIFLGVDNSKLHRFFDGKAPVIRDARSMEEAVALAHGLAQEGDTVLLSPCCASFDLFANYEDRGNQFKACVRKL